MLSYVCILVKLHPIRLFPLSLVGLTIYGGPAPDLAHFPDLLEKFCLLLLTHDVILLLHFLFLPLICFKIPWLMGAMFVERTKTRVEASSFDILFAKHVTIS